jgi:proteasome lid subunit RPN8/RPN11
MPFDDYSYFVELYSPQGSTLGRAPIVVDWEPAREWTVFSALREGRHSSLPALGATLVHPRWHEELGEPYMAGFRVAVENNGGAEFCVDFHNAYFKKLAEAASLQLVEQGTMSLGDSFLYSVLACRSPQAERREEAAARTAREIPPHLPIESDDMAGYLRLAVPFNSPTDGDIPVFVPQQVLAEIAALSREAGPTESGGVLIGHLHRDSSGGGIFLVVTAQIPARHSLAGAASLTFTAESWSAARDAIRLRGAEEIMVGWFHSHPVRDWCKKCPAEKRTNCTTFESYFSPQDEALHRTVFSRAWCVALLVSEMPERSAAISLFGWREGLIESRGFHAIDESALAAEVE